MDGLGSWEKILIYFMLGILPWIFVAVGGWLLWSARNFMARAIRTRGRVLQVSQQTSTSSSNGTTRRTTTYKPLFEYTDPNGEIRKAETFLASTSYNYAIGSEHEILIDPEGGTVRIPGFMIYGFGAIFAGIGLLFGIVGIFALSAM